MIPFITDRIMLPFAGVGGWPIFTALILMAVGALAITRTTSRGSALTAAERSTSFGKIRPQSGFHRFILRWIPWLIPIACASFFFIDFSFSAYTAVLRSRARSTNSDWAGHFTERTKALNLVTKAILDLGPFVDHATETLVLQRADTWSLPTADMHRRISLAVVAALDQVPVQAVRGNATASLNEEKRLPRWIIESVEKMVLDGIRHRANIKQIIFQFEQRSVSGVEVWGSESILQARLSYNPRRLNSMDPAVIIPMPNDPPVKLVHAAGRVDDTKKNWIDLVFLCGPEVPTPGPVDIEIGLSIFLRNGGKTPMKVSIEAARGVLVAIAIEVTEAADSVEQLNADKKSLGAIAINPQASPSVGNRKRAFAFPGGHDTARKWLARIAAGDQDWTADWSADLLQRYGLNLQQELQEALSPTSSPLPPTEPLRKIEDEVIQLQAAAGAATGSRTLQGLFVPEASGTWNFVSTPPRTLTQSGLSSVSYYATAVHSAGSESFRTGTYQRPGDRRPVLGTTGDDPLLIAASAPAIDTGERDFTAACLTSSLLASAKQGKPDMTLRNTIGATTIGPDRMEDTVREMSVGRQASLHLGIILSLVLLYTIKCCLTLWTISKS